MAPKIRNWQPRSLGEYTYGQQMTTEVVDHVGGLTNLRAAPIVPSLQAEADLGFDVKIPATWVTLFLQYKVSAHLTRNNASQAGEMGVPYFRFSVKTGRIGDDTCQHNVLRDLQQELVGHMAFVFYAAPAFVFASWDTLALHRQVADHSIFIPPMELEEVVPGDPHCFAYTGIGSARAFSEPRSVTAVSIGSVLDIAASASVSRDQS